MPCSSCGKARSKPVARSRSAPSPTYTYTAPDGSQTTDLTRPQAENLRSRNGGQGRIQSNR